MKSVKHFVANTKPVLSTGIYFVCFVLNRYDTEFVKGNEKEVGCKELFEPYQKCIMVYLILVSD